MKNPFKKKLDVKAREFHNVFHIKERQWADLVMKKVSVCIKTESVVDSFKKSCPNLTDEQLLHVMATIEAHMHLAKIQSKVEEIVEAQALGKMNDEASTEKPPGVG